LLVRKRPDHRGLLAYAPGVPATGDYVLGTGDAEVERLGLQHRVWRETTLDCWHRAGVANGASVLDLGAGPGYAALDLAQLVGPTGRVTAVERSRRFLDILAARAEERGFVNLTTLEADLVVDPLPPGPFDFAWCRWVASFVPHPERLIAKLATVLRPGGVAIFHEYASYATWRMLPRHPPFERFVALIMESWRRAGGEPDVAIDLPSMLAAAGLSVIHTKPILSCVGPADDRWHWLAAFVESGLARLVELEMAAPDRAEDLLRWFRATERAGRALVLTPTVLEIFAVWPPPGVESAEGVRGAE
jgi:SAM-dependent methyltransferase